MATKQKSAGNRTSSRKRNGSQPKSNTSQSQGTTTRGQTANTTGQPGQSQMTTDPEEIQRWVQERGGYPATVVGTGGDDDAGVLRIDYPGFSGEDSLERISWDEFFDKFQEADLVFLYQEETKDGAPSRFSKFISREQAETQRSR